MAWLIEWEPIAEKQLEKLDFPIQKKIRNYLHERVTTDPRATASPLVGNKSGLWRYRVGDYRIICRIKDHLLVVLVLEVGHRKDVYD
ncbi:MAG: type II toxin-antitoxin system RelE/ParE family toxin [Proteobacteria bacterium]|nr:type II toxin-antitoxin system RelE/ParE family toxin [Pseudomonadota bacterium]